MHARYFGPPAKRLFGVFDEPAPGGSSELGAVLCHPHGADYDSAFRSLRILAARLARAGVQVLRFDYLGTGDSAGDVEDASVPEWIDNIGAALHELRSRHELREVSLVGLRLGATLAALAAAGCQTVDRVVLWEPVVDGGEYLRTLRALHRSWLEEESRAGRAALSADDDALGYRLTERLRSDFERLSLLSLQKAPAPYVSIISQTPSSAHDLLAERLRGLGAGVDTDCVEGPTIWSRTPAMDQALVSSGVVQAIVARLTGVPR
jgi:pimeloyl-ACP methyl ester carboxylesterase